MKRIDIPIINRNPSISSINNLYKKTSYEKLIKKHHAHEPFTRDDLISLYDIYNIREISKDYNDNTLDIISNIKIQRNIKQDMATIFGCRTSEITNSFYNIMWEPYKYVVLLSNLIIDNDLVKTTTKIKFEKLRYISNDCRISNTPSFNYDLIDVFPSLESVGGELSLPELLSATGLENLHSIGGNAVFNNLQDAHGLSNLEIIGKCAIFDKLKDAIGLEKLKIIGEDAVFNNLTDASQLKSLEYIGGREMFPKLNNTEKNKIRIRIK